MDIKISEGGPGLISYPEKGVMFFHVNPGRFPEKDVDGIIIFKDQGGSDNEKSMVLSDWILYAISWETFLFCLFKNTDFRHAKMLDEMIWKADEDFISSHIFDFM